MNTSMNAILSPVRFPHPSVVAPIVNRHWLAAATALALLAAPAASAFVYETGQEFYSTGDFNGDGQTDIVIVDRYTGRVRIGYRVSTEFFNWANWRPSGLKDVSGVAIGKLVDENYDSLALVSADANLISVVSAANANVPTDPIKITSTALGPNAVAAVDVGGDGNTPLHDLYIASIYNNDPENRVTLLRAEAGTITQTAEVPATGAESRGNRLALKSGGPEFVATMSSDANGNSLRVETLAGGKPEAVLSIGGLPAGADYLVGNFRGTALKEFVFYLSGEPNLMVSTIEDAGSGKFKASALKTLTLERAPKQLIVVDGGTKSRLIGVFGTNEPAELLEFDAAHAPVLVQKLDGMTNKVLSAAVALPEAVVLFSSLMPGRATAHYQIDMLKDGRYSPGAYGSLASLADRDDSTVPEIYQRIAANQSEKSAADMKPYTNTIPGSEVSFEMVPIPGGEFVMGSPDGEKDRKPDEGPQHKVKISPFWIGKYEVTWDEFLLFVYPDDEKKLRETHATPEEVNKVSDAVTRPSKPYVDMSFGMGKSGYPAIAMTQHGANKFCHWLSAKTGHFYRLPTEAEWEYACRAGTTTAYSFGDDAGKLPEYGWFFDNSNSKYQKVGRKKPNPWGLYDMHGNVTEWVLDQYDEDYYKTLASAGLATDPWKRAMQPYPHSARGGSWDDDPPALRSAARRASDRSWKMTDPQLPKGIWYHTDAQFIGFRIVRPLTVPSAEEMTRYWISGVEKD